MRWRNGRVWQRELDEKAAIEYWVEMHPWSDTRYGEGISVQFKPNIHDSFFSFQWMKAPIFPAQNSVEK